VPNPASVTVRAASVADPSKCGTAFVTLNGPVTVSVQPTTATVEAGGGQPFSALVTGTVNTTVTWAVDGGAANGTITDCCISNATITTA
jgi:hypothetical protein